MTFNIRHGNGMDRRVDLNRAAGVIRAARPDVVGLQEVDRHFSDRSGFLDQAGQLAGTLSMHLAYGANLDLDPPTAGGPRRQFGNAILSRHPVLDSENVLLPRFADHEQRGLLRAEIAAGSRPWQIFTTHLQPNAAAERLAQARAVADRIGAPQHPLVLLADLNATPGTPEIRALTVGLADAWPTAGGWFGSTFPNPFPYRRIDYVLHSPAGRAETAVVVGSLSARIASDHLPVVADIAPI
ncbi:MAG TPA: endonuclease/exonuclease/phosphatase family protein [Actinoplanes sp.]|nr:endonuclease/exonuclease/phosphatase family protein [Actinoplanes sp.]